MFDSSEQSGKRMGMLEHWRAAEMDDWKVVTDMAILQTGARIADFQ
jgi:hypothetical protein